MGAGCVIRITFPSEMEIENTLTLVEGLGIFGSKRELTGSMNGNQFTITNGCLAYTNPDYDAKIDFSNVINPDSI